MSTERVEFVAKSLGIEPIPDTMDKLRREIRQEMRDLHPDRNAGDFTDSDARERFTQLSTALAQIDSDGSATALVPVSTVAPLVSSILDALGSSALDVRESSAVQAQTLRTEAKDEARHRFRLSRLGSGVAGSLTTGLWALPVLATALGSANLTTAIQGSILAPIFAHPLSEPILFGLALYAWLFFAMTWFMEQNDLRRIDWVTTDEARGVLLRRAVLTARQRGDADTVTKADMRDALGRGLRPTLVLRLLGARDVSASFLDRVTNQHVAELETRGVLTPTGDVELSPRYFFDDNVAEGLRP